MPISTELIKLSGVVSTGDGQSHSQDTKQNSSTNVSAGCFSIKMALELSGNYVLLINCNCIQYSWHLPVFTNNMRFLGGAENREFADIWL